MINRKGQGLVELIVAIAIIEVGLFSVWSLFLVNFNAEREAESRIVGVNLAREGVEVIKNIRDSNWLKRKNNIPISRDNPTIWSWDQNLEAGTSTIDYSSEVLDGPEFTAIYLTPEGFFTNNNIEGNIKTVYSRQISIKDICCLDADQNLKCDGANPQYSIIETGNCDLKIGINVVSQVSWELAGNKRQATVEDNLYDWQ